MLGEFMGMVCAAFIVFFILLTGLIYYDIIL